MTRRVQASERTRERIEELLGELPEDGGLREALLLGVRRLIEEALEGEVSEALGRGYYERSEGPARGHRNGWRTGRLKSAEGEIEYDVPQVRGLAFRSKLRPELAHRGPRGSGRRDVRAEAVDARHRGHVLR